MHPLGSVKTNPILEDDLADILTVSGRAKFRPTPDFLWIKQNDLFAEVTQAYLACCSYADACVGVILDQLNSSEYADNTIVVLWGDHGWHLGEKLRYRKATPWSEATRLPLIISTPAMTELSRCSRPVNLIDLYPTLIDFCGLPAKDSIDGDSLVPLLLDSEAKWREATVTIFGSGDASVVGTRWRYIHHRDGSEELYDLQEDPLEWNNLIRSPNSVPRRARERLKKFVPQSFAPPIEKSDSSLKKKANQIDLTLKATRDLNALK
jgi:arylsulfatase A-like enzyme